MCTLSLPLSPCVMLACVCVCVCVCFCLTASLFVCLSACLSICPCACTTECVCQGTESRVATLCSVTYNVSSVWNTSISINGFYNKQAKMSEYCILKLSALLRWYMNMMLVCRWRARVCLCVRVNLITRIPRFVPCLRLFHAGRIEKHRCKMHQFVDVVINQSID